MRLNETHTEQREKEYICPLALQGLFQHKEIDVGILCVVGKETFARVKADLTWLGQVVTAPVLLVGLQ
jgi:hypothetical protein